MSFEFDGVELSRWLDANPVRSFAPPITHKTIEIPGRDGACFIETRREPLTISVQVRLNGSDPDHRVVGYARRIIASALLTDGPRKLVLPDEPHLYYLASLNNADELDTLWHTGGCTLEFIAFDPYAYGPEHRIPLDAGENTVCILGTAKTWPVFELASTGGKVRISNGSEYVLLSANAANEATVVVDMEEATARINTNLSAVDLESLFFELSPGAQTITLENAAGSLVYRERWS